jgi:hypothetical protein
MAVSHEWAHVELGRQRHCRTVVRRGRRHIAMGAMRGDVAQEAKGPCLVAAFTALAREHHGTVGAGASVVDLIREHIASPRCSTLSE